MHGAHEQALLQAGHQGAGLARVDALGAQAVAAVHGQGLVQLGFLAGRSYVEHAARLQQRVLAKTFGRRAVEATAGACQRAYLRGAVALHEHGGRAARGVVSGLRLAFQHHYRGAAPGQPPGHRGTGHAATDHREIQNLAFHHPSLHFFPMRKLSDKKKMRQAPGPRGFHRVRRTRKKGTAPGRPLWQCAPHAQAGGSFPSQPPARAWYSATAARRPRARLSAAASWAAYRSRCASSTSYRPTLPRW